jgi:hypothetical protein
MHRHPFVKLYLTGSTGRSPACSTTTLAGPCISQADLGARSLNERRLMTASIGRGQPAVNVPSVTPQTGPAAPNTSTAAGQPNTPAPNPGWTQNQGGRPVAGSGPVLAPNLPPGWRIPNGAAGGGAIDPALLTAAIGLTANPEAISALASAFGPALPPGTSYAQVTPNNMALNGMVETANFDEAHDGRFSVPGSNGTVSRDSVFAQADPAAFIRDNLSYGNSGNVLTVFIPGLNTPEPESERRLQQQYSPRLNNRQMAHRHLGSDNDQGPADFTLDPAIAAALQTQAGALSAAGVMPSLRTENGVTYARIEPGQRDRVEAVFVDLGLLETEIMRSTKALLTSQLERPGGPQQLNLMLYSRGSIDGAAAIKGWVDDFTARNSARMGGPEAARGEATRLLRENVLVETLGNSTRNFPDGPMYIHWSATNDPLTSQVGATSRNPQGGGQNAVYAHYDGIYQGFDAHNFGAVGAAALQLTLELNGVASSRALYDQVRAGTPLVQPTSDQVRQRIQQTNGDAWLWNPDAAGRVGQG